MKKKLDVVAALIRRDNKFLLCQRQEGDHYGLLWEFPGGTVEKEDESLSCAIEREIKEELGLEVTAENMVAEFEDEDDTLIIKVFLFRCVIKGGIPKNRECRDFGFFGVKEARVLPLAPADKKIVAYLSEIWKKG